MQRSITSMATLVWSEAVCHFSNRSPASCSASGGMSIALQTLGSTYLEMGRAAGIDAALLHRVTTIATGGLDTLPHNGAVITLLAICKLTHRQSYFDIFVVAVAFPLVALAAVVALGSVFGAF